LRYGGGPAIALSVNRTVLTWMVAGTPLSSLLVALIAGTVSLAVVGFFLRPWVKRGLVGWIGLGMASAGTHNLVQLWVVETLLVDHAGFFFQLAPIALWSAVSGAIMALAAASALPFWNRLFAREGRDGISPGVMPMAGGTVEPGKVIFFWLGLVYMAAVLFWPRMWGQAGLWVITIVLAWLPLGDGQTGSRRWRRVFRAMKSTWPLLLFLAWLHLFHGEGHLVGWGNVTLEGINAFILHAFRLLTLAGLGPLLLPFFPRAWLAKSGSPHAQGMLIALPALAGLPAAIPAAVREGWATWRSKDDRGHRRGFAAGLETFAARILAETSHWMPAKPRP